MEPVEKVNNSAYFTVFSMNIAAQLMLMKFKPVIVKNNKDDRFYTFKFRNTEEFQKAFNELVK
jgi:hypothetical protein